MGKARNDLGSRGVRTTDLVGLCVVKTICRGCSRVAKRCNESSMSSGLCSVVAIDSGSTTGALAACLNNNSSTTNVRTIGDFYRTRNCSRARVKHVLLTDDRGSSGCASMKSYNRLLRRVCGRSASNCARTTSVFGLLGTRAHYGGVPTRLPRKIGATGGAKRLSGIRGSTKVVCSSGGSMMVMFVSRGLSDTNSTRGAVTALDEAVCSCCGWVVCSRDAWWPGKKIRCRGGGGCYGSRSSYDCSYYYVYALRLASHCNV